MRFPGKLAASRGEQRPRSTTAKGWSPDPPHQDQPLRGRIPQGFSSLPTKKKTPESGADLSWQSPRQKEHASHQRGHLAHGGAHNEASCRPRRAGLRINRFSTKNGRQRKVEGIAI